MTDVIDMSDRRNTSAEKTSRRSSIAHALEKTRNELRAPMIAFDLLNSNFPGWFRAGIVVRISKSSDEELVSGKTSFDIEDVAPKMAPLHRLISLRDQLRNIADPSCDKRKARFIVALMIDAFPNARPHSPETFVEVVVDEVVADGVDAAVLAHACGKLVREKAFLPAPAEILEACKQITSVQSAITSLDQAIRIHELLTRGYEAHQKREREAEARAEAAQARERERWV